MAAPLLLPPPPPLEIPHPLAVTADSASPFGPPQATADHARCALRDALLISPRGVPNAIAPSEKALLHLEAVHVDPRGQVWGRGLGDALIAPFEKALSAHPHHLLPETDAENILCVGFGVGEELGGERPEREEGVTTPQPSKEQRHQTRERRGGSSGGGRRTTVERGGERTAQGERGAKRGGVPLPPPQPAFAVRRRRASQQQLFALAPPCVLLPVAAHLSSAAACTSVVAARLPAGLFCIGKYLPSNVLIDELSPHCSSLGPMLMFQH
ncbi:hypothetical protein Scep_019587 [Stephania cephalantha]|uniref:Uncharacterized protein n=1 Tax=Stephania cephalantha TaxID=152367 RepID=A0AAP0IBH3_9MAGN